MTEHDRSRGRHEEEGDCRIDVYLTGVSADDVDELVERIADVLSESGLGAEDDDAPIRSLVGVKPYPWPDFEDERVAAEIVEEYSEWVIPGGGDEED
jgi:hypothetical protein